MAKDYRVPSIKRAHDILNLLAEEPSRLRLIDLSKKLEINKSSMYSLLFTLETLGWVVKDKGDTYSLGPSLGVLSASYFRQFNLLQSFHKEAPITVHRVEETVQLAMLDGKDVVYLAKEESRSPIRLVSDPGMRFPAFATALGKILLSQYEKEEIKSRYSSNDLEIKTPYTVKTIDQLYEQLELIQRKKYACDIHEAVEGFCCVATPIYNHLNKMIAAVSISMSEANWDEKYSIAHKEITSLAARISKHAGHLQN